MKITVDMIEAQHHRKLTPFRVGDQVRVMLKIIEGDSERLQAFEGTVIRLRGHGLSRSFTVRKISYGVGVERTLLLHSPRIDKIDVVRSGHVRRGRLYFLRDRTGKAARLDEKLDHRETLAESAPAAASAVPSAPAAAAPVSKKQPPLSAAPARS